MAKLIKGTKVASKKAVEEYMTFEAFKDEVIEGALDMLFSRFDECQKQVRLLYPDLDLGKLEREFPTD